tara:strand:+ start:635 stop:856 length:222 start_codon:yes stop_codon:yes gene_type:complete
MDNNDIDFNNFLEKVTKLENIIENQMDNRDFNAILYSRFNIRIENIDTEYNKLLIRKITENLINEQIFNLIDL